VFVLHVRTKDQTFSVRTEDHIKEKPWRERNTLKLNPIAYNALGLGLGFDSFRLTLFFEVKSSQVIFDKICMIALLSGRCQE